MKALSISVTTAERRSFTVVVMENFNVIKQHMQLCVFMCKHQGLLRSHYEAHQMKDFKLKEPSSNVFKKKKCVQQDPVMSWFRT